MTKTKLMQTRLAKGLSQEELADLIGMTQSNYSRRENGHKKISEKEWDKIAKELDVTKESIYEDDFNTSKIKNTMNMHQIHIPEFVLDHIEFLKKENNNLKKELDRLRT